jgi:hypothetical protein
MSVQESNGEQPDVVRKVSFEIAIKKLKGKDDAAVTDGDISDLKELLNTHLRYRASAWFDKGRNLRFKDMVNVSDQEISLEMLGFLRDYYMRKLQKNKEKWLSAKDVCEKYGLIPEYLEAMNDVLLLIWLKFRQDKMVFKNQRFLRKNVVGRFYDGDSCEVRIHEQCVMEFITISLVQRIHRNLNGLPANQGAVPISRLAKMNPDVVAELPNILKNYIKEGGRSIKEFFDLVCKECGYTQEQLELKLGLGSKYLATLDEERNFSPYILDNMENAGVSRRAVLQMSAMRAGRLEEGSVTSFVSDARAILLEKEPKFESFHNNKIARRLTEVPNGVSASGVLNKDLVPNILLERLLYRFAIQPTTFFDKIGYAYSKACKIEGGLEAVLNGARGLFVQKTHSCTKYLFDKAKETGLFFASKPSLQRDISYVMIGLPGVLRPSELKKLHDDGSMTFPEVCTRLRVQKFLTVTELERYALGLSEKDNPPTINNVPGIESGKRPASREAAKRIAKKVYEDFPHDNSQEWFLQNLSKKHICASR